MKTLLTNAKSISSVKDLDQVIFTEEKSLMEFLNSVKKNTEVRNVPLNLLCPKGAEYSLMLDMSDFSHTRVGDLDIPDIGDEAVISCLMDSESQIFVTVPNGNKWKWMPLRGISYESLLERAELACKGLKRTVDTGRWFAVPAKERAKVIDLFLQSSKPVRTGKGMEGPRTAKVVAVHKKVNYFGSSAYAYAADRDVYNTAKKVLGKEFPNVALNKTWWDYGLTVTDLSLNDSNKNDSLLESLNATEEKYSSASYGIRIMNSLAGKSALKALPFVSVDGKKIAIDTGIKAKAIHMGGSIMDRFQDSLEAIVEKSFQEIDDLLEELGNIEISDVAKVIEEMSNNIPELHGITSAIKHGTAIDCLLEAIKDQPEELIVSRYLLYLDYKSIEEGTFEWSSLKK